MSRKVSLAIEALCKKYGDKEALKFAKEIGCDGVDFSLFHLNKADQNCIYAKSEEEIAAYFTELREEAEKLGLFFAQTHGRLEGFKNEKEADDLLVENARLDCLVTKVLGAPVCVVHSVTTIFLGPDADRKLMHDLNVDMFTRILPFAEEFDIKIATETFGDAVQFDCCDFFGNINEFLISYQKILAATPYKNRLCVCVDTGHSNKAMRFNNNPKPSDVIRMLGEKTKVLHLNDNDTFTDQHKTPMTGTIDWEDVFCALDEVGYNGVYNMELNLFHFGESFMVEEARFAIKVLKHILKERYGEN